mmetsp:Transcript_6867/g.27997  ORF Transcript_6867/g.27997 Transcript_6867/m.27997 type:complete len:200 (+) Transcript_6867:414-1013(+)
MQGRGDENLGFRIEESGHGRQRRGLRCALLREARVVHERIDKVGGVPPVRGEVLVHLRPPVPHEVQDLPSVVAVHFGRGGRRRGRARPRRRRGAAAGDAPMGRHVRVGAQRRGTCSCGHRAIDGRATRAAVRARVRRGTHAREGEAGDVRGEARGRRRSPHVRRAPFESVLDECFPLVIPRHSRRTLATLTSQTLGRGA